MAETEAATKPGQTETDKTEAEKPDRPNTVTITDAGPSRKKIAIEIPAETVAEQLGTSLDTLMVEAELPGFRKGRAPRRLIEKKFGSGVRKEAKTQLVAAAYSKAVEENKLRVIGEPTSEMLEKIEVEEGKPLAFEFEVEVLPEFELPSLENIPVRKPTMDVTDDMVAAEISKMALHEGSLESREKVSKGDYLTGHATMVDSEGVEHLDIADAVIQVPTDNKNGRGMILGIMVDDFADQLALPEIGDTVTIKANGPEQHETEAIRGKDLTITFKVSRADAIIPAALNDLVARYGMETEAELRDAMKSRISQKVMIDQQTVMRQQVARHLIEAVKIEMPERVTAQQAARTLARRRMELMHRGVSPEKIEEHIAELRAASASAAVTELKLFFILDKAAESLDIKVSDAEINGRISQMAMSRNMRPEKLRQELIQRDQVGTVFQQIREHKVMDAILAKAKISEMSAEEFNKAMAAESGGSPSGEEAPSKPGAGESNPAGQKKKQSAPEPDESDDDAGKVEKKTAKKTTKKKTTKKDE